MSDKQQQGAAPHLPPFGISTALLASEVPAGAEPEWIKVTPRGTADTRDGRVYLFDPEKLVARFKADAIDVAADIDHALALRATKGEKADAIGWVKELKAQPDGTYARVEWLPAGKATLAARTHRYVSPTFHHTEAGEATWIHSVSLVAAPALNMPALASALPGKAGDAPATVRQALGLDATADDAACLAAIGELRAAFVPIGLFNDAVATLNAATVTIAELRGGERKRKVGELIEGALRAFKITPAQRAQYEALCQTEAGFTHVATLFANTVPMFQPSGLDQRRPDTGNASETPEMLSARAARYRDAQAASGVALTHAEAVRALIENPTLGR